MDWLLKAVLTAGSVLLVLGVARRAGRRAAGIVAALPTLTGPTLAWLAHDLGDAFAARAAVASVAAGALLAIFALVHAHVARHRGVACALGCGALAVALLARPVALAADALAVALAVAIAACVAALRCLPSPPGPLPRPPAAPRAATALAAAVLGATTVAAAPLFGSAVAGLLASLPLVSGAVVASEHASSGHVGVAHFLRGFVAGLLVRTAFCAAFALLAVPLGGLEASVVAALAAGVVWLLANEIKSRRARHRAARRGAARRREPVRAVTMRLESPSLRRTLQHSGRGAAACATPLARSAPRLDFRTRWPPGSRRRPPRPPSPSRRDWS